MQASHLPGGFVHGQLDTPSFSWQNGAVKRRKPAASKADFSGCACAGLHLPKLVQPLVMAALLERPLHGYAIVQRLAADGALAAAPPDHSGVYRLLRRLARRGLVT